jgi:2-oxo-3-hexenedioate decarboxylase
MSPASGEVSTLARELLDAHTTGRGVAAAPSERPEGLGLDAAYAIEAEITRLRREDGRVTVGRKVGYANKAVWRVFKLQTLVWAQMYDDTVHEAPGGAATLSVAGRCSPRIEPEVVLKLKDVPSPGDAAAALAAVEWVALGFEIVDSPFPEWRFQPADFVAALGLHAALVVGPPRPVTADAIPALVEELAAMKVRLSRNGELVEEGAGRNALRSPALCLAELAAAIAARPDAEPLRAGELVSTGTLTNAQPIATGERWEVSAGGIDLAPLSLTL